MLKRPGGIDFPDLHVFPGGKVDEDDDLDELCDALTDRQASELLGLSSGAARYWVAAARECFEECGILLARRDGEMIRFDDPAERDRFDGHRRELTGGRLRFAELLRGEGLTIACDQMVYFSHWLTPESAPRRFDTRFFCASLPAGQRTLAHEWETADSDWIPPESALARHEQGEWQMIHPTFVTLMSLQQYPTLAAVMAAALEESHLPELTAELNAQGMQTLR